MSLGKENYEALIERHGQWVRWRVAYKCPCVKHNSQQADIHCKKCGGLGIVYGYQDKAQVSQTVMIQGTSSIIELDEGYTDCSLLRVYDNSGREYPYAAKTGSYVLLNAPVEKGVYVTAVMIQNVLSTKENVELLSLGNNWYRVQGLRVSRTKTEGLYHTAPCDIEEISGIFDEKGVEFVAEEKRQDCVYIPPIKDSETDEIIAPVGTLTAKSVEYLPPFTFVILGQNLSKADTAIMDELGGDAVLTFPYAYDVSNDDVITVLSGTYTQKTVLTHNNSDYDVIPAYFVDEVIKCVGKNRDYTAGVDFILCGTNYIKWLAPDAPKSQECYSITYRVFPTYKVLKAIPQIRTSENQRMPEKAVIKLYDAYGEKRGINRQ